ncbi:MAG: SpoIIE family protein phosphatase [Bernardetiaceae bacterium]|nr:SpoIIE family protein phosphatase [Bernardetiaceae bacterium]
MIRYATTYLLSTVIIVYSTLLLLLFPSVIKAQTFKSLRFESLSIENGLSQNTVTSILQDSQGFLWFGTQDGLNRYDAYEVRIFRHRRDNPNSISENSIKVIFEDSDKQLWIGTIRGLNLFDRKTQTFTALKRNNNIPNSIIHDDINAIAEDSKGNIWIGTPLGLSCYSKTTRQFTNYTHDENDANSLVINTVKSLMVDNEDRVWIGTERGLSIYDQTLKTFLNYDETTLQSGLKNFNILDILQDDSKNIWIATNMGLHLYNPDKHNFEYKAFFFNGAGEPLAYLVNKIMEKTPEVLSLCLNDEIYLEYNYKTNTTDYYRFPEETGALDYVYKDRSNLIWIGSHNLGALKYDEYLERFQQYQNDPDNPNSLLNNIVWNFTEDKQNRAWIVTDKGISVSKSKNSSEFRNYTPQNTPSLPQRGGFSHAFTTRSGEVWIGFIGAPLHRLKEEKNDGSLIFESLRLPANATEQDRRTIASTLATVEDHKGDLWIAGFRGLCRIIKDPQDNNNYSFEHYYKKTEGFDVEDNELPSDAIWSIFEDSKKRLWLGTDRGLSKAIRNDYGSIVGYQNFMQDPDDTTSLSSDMVRSIWEDKEGMLWIGTTNGFNRFNPETNKAKHFGDYIEQANYAVYGILGDENDRIWVSTNNGLLNYDYKTDKLVTYTSKDGLQSNEFNSGSYYKGKDGKLYFGGIKGFNAFHPDSIGENKYTPPVLITNFKIANEEVPLRSAQNPNSPLEFHISVTEEIRLSYDQNTISFEFVALNYRLPEKNQYAYKLEGLDNQLNYVGDRRFVSYNNLPPGEYVFKVIGSNSDGKFNEEGASVRIIITPPVWMTWWFRILVFVLLVASAFGIYRNRVSAIEKQKKILEEQVAERTAEIAEKSESLEKQKDEVERSYNNIRILSEIGQKITAILDLDEMIAAVYSYVNRLTDANAFGIGIYNEEKRRIEFRGFIEKGKRIPDSYDSLDDEDRLSVWSLKNNKEIIINDFDKEHYQYVKTRIKIPVGDRSNSLIYMPLEIDSRIVGVITVQSLKKNAYKRNDLTILRTLASYISIALVNASTYEKLEGATDTIKSKNQAIMNSIRYGKTIQQAILPNEKLFNTHFADHKIIYKPQAVVSGDFYWLQATANKVFLAVVDCTGHGVPGAFMSMIGNTLLNETVSLKGITEPKAMLENLHTSIREALHQKEAQNTDGLDIALASIEKLPDDKFKIVFAGAKRSLFYYANGRLYELKGDKKSIGGRQKEDKREFSQQEVLLTKGDVLYFTTDGFVDQHNEARVKFGTLKFKQILAAVADKSLTEQHETLKAALEKHRGEQELRDDITMVTVKL